MPISCRSPDRLARRRVGQPVTGLKWHAGRVSGSDLCPPANRLTRPKARPVGENRDVHRGRRGTCRPTPPDVVHPRHKPGLKPRAERCHVGNRYEGRNAQKFYETAPAGSPRFPWLYPLRSNRFRKRRYAFAHHHHTSLRTHDPPGSPGLTAQITAKLQVFQRAPCRAIY